MEDVDRLGKKLTINYSILQAVSIAGYCCVFSFAPVFLLAHGFSNSELGITFTVGNTFGLLFGPVVAAFADRTTRYSVRTLAAVMFALCALFSFFLLLLPPQVLPIAVVFILLLGFFTTEVSLVTSMAMEHINRGVPLNYSLARGIGSFAYASLSLGMGFLVQRFGPQIVMVTNIGLGLIGMVLVYTFRTAAKSAAPAGRDEPKAAGLLEFALKNRRFMAVVAGGALLFFSHIVINTYTIQIIRRVGGDSSQLGIAIAIAGFLELPAMALFPWFHRKMRSPGAILKLSGVFVVLKAILTLLAPNVLWIYVAQSLQFFAYALFLPASVYYVNQVIGQADKVKGQTIMAMSMGISGIIGNFLGGFMLDSRGGVPFMLTVGILISAAGLVLLLAVVKRTGNQPAREMHETV